MNLHVRKLLCGNTTGLLVVCLAPLAQATITPNKVVVEGGPIAGDSGGITGVPQSLLVDFDNEVTTGSGFPQNYKTSSGTIHSTNVISLNAAQYPDVSTFASQNYFAGLSNGNLPAGFEWYGTSSPWTSADLTTDDGSFPDFPLLIAADVQYSNASNAMDAIWGIDCAGEDRALNGGPPTCTSPGNPAGCLFDSPGWVVWKGTWSGSSNNNVSSNNDSGYPTWTGFHSSSNTEIWGILPGQSTYQAAMAAGTETYPPSISAGESNDDVVACGTEASSYGDSQVFEMNSTQNGWVVQTGLYSRFLAQAGGNWFTVRGTAGDIYAFIPNPSGTCQGGSNSGGACTAQATCPGSTCAASPWIGSGYATGISGILGTTFAGDNEVFVAWTNSIGGSGSNLYLWAFGSEYDPVNVAFTTNTTSNPCADTNGHTTIVSAMFDRQYRGNLYISCQANSGVPDYVNTRIVLQINPSNMYASYPEFAYWGCGASGCSD
jgi:hypothetical protein